MAGIPGFGAKIHYPDETVDRLALTEIPVKGATISLRASRWLIVDIHATTSPTEQDEGILYDVWVQPVEEHG